MTRAQLVLDRIAERVDASSFVAHGLHVLVGDEVATRRWAPDVREDIQSVAKGVCVLAAGIAADDGVVSLDVPVVEYVPQIDRGRGIDEVTLRHLLSMTSGVDFPWSETMMTDWPDVAAEFLSRASEGRAFQYSNASTYTAMTVLAACVGDVGEFVRERLLSPLGIDDALWERCPNGRIVAGGGLSLRTEELARVGRLVRDRGVWNGQQVVSARWIDAMHTDWVEAGSSPGYERYALAGWDGPGPAWRLHGAHGQLVIFVGDAVVTLTAHDHFGADAMAAAMVEILQTS